MVEKRAFKGSDEKISLLGFGAMRLPVTNAETEEIDTAKAEKMINYAWESGVNYFDTAWPYHNGQSETVLARALARYPRESYFLADKMPIWEVNTPSDVEDIFEKQLVKCGVDYFDFYLLHSMSVSKWEKTRRFKAYDYLAKQKEKGRIRRLGFSFHDTAATLETIADVAAWDFAQIQLNYLDWELLDARGQYDVLTKRSIPVAVMEPVRGGTLATLSPEALALLAQAGPNVSAASWAIRFAAGLPNVYTVLSGMSTMEQLKDNIKTMSPFSPLSDSERKLLNDALVLFRKVSPILCTGCRYCMDCPNGVDIPKNFELYNHYLQTSEWSAFINGYFTIGADKQAARCIGCGICQDKCPQKINIPDLMPKIADAYDKIEKPIWFK